MEIAAATPPAVERQRIAAAMLACFALSGATGLVYEIVWMRMLGLAYGHTIVAVTTVLAVFMAGLGLGSLAFGRFVDRTRDALLLYGALEIGIGLTCLAVPIALPVFESRVALAFAVLVPPTVLMGATLPVMSRFFVDRDRAPGIEVGRLYAANTFGAVLGAALAGYLLLPTLGMRRTLWLAAAVNVLIGFLAVAWALRLRRIDSRRERESRAPVATDDAAASTEGSSWRLLGVAAAGLAASGAASMTYEVAWTRALALVIGSSTYAFTAMLVAFLGGIALGSALFARLFRTRRVDAATFGLIQLGIGATALAIVPLFTAMPDVLLRTLAVSLAPGFVLATQVGLSVATMLAPAVLIGASFPCGVALAVPGRGRIGADVGRLYAANTAGAIAGTVAAGFLLVPLLGTQTAIKVAVALNLGVGALFALASLRSGARWRPLLAGGLTVATAAGLVTIPSWDVRAMSSGVAVYAGLYRGLAGTRSVARATAGSEVVFYEDGDTATVSVHRQGEQLFMRINGKTDASTGRDMRTQRLLGHLPLLLHPEARSVLVIGLGSGVTVGAVAAHPVERIDVVEIEPAVIRASRFFTRENGDALRDPRVRVATADGRSFLLAERRTYDVIVSEPSNPWIAGIATLFSEEFYALARRRLAPGGVMIQWVHGYSLVPDDLRMIVRTFQTAFPATTIWFPNTRGDYVLAGRAAPRPLDLARVAAGDGMSVRLRDAITDLAGGSPYGLIADFLLTEPDAARYAAHAEINTDDRLPLEFSAPRSLYAETEPQNFRLMTSFKTLDRPALTPDSQRGIETAAGRHALALAYERKDMPAEAAAQFELALERDPSHVPSLVGLGKARLRLGAPLRGIEHLEQARALEPGHAQTALELSRAYRAQRLTARALETATAAVKLSPGDAAIRLNLASLLAEVGRDGEALEHLEAARRAAPGDTGVTAALAVTHLRRGRVAEGTAVLRDALDRRPNDAVLLELMGRAQLAAGRYDEAARVLERAIAESPTLAIAHVSLGYAHLGRGNPRGAVASLEHALELDPTHAAAARALAEIRANVSR